MRVHIIENGRVANTIVAESLEHAATVLPDVELVSGEAGGNPGDVWDGESFTPFSPPASVADYMAAVQQHMDARAVSFGYDNLISVISYAEEPSVPRYQAEGQAFRAWRSQCWYACEQILQQVKNGDRPPPAVAELIVELPLAPVQDPID